MKMSFNDAYGSSVICVMKLNGDPAVEKVDYINWEGEYHKNGKFSYTEGGVALKNGIICHLSRSTHSRWDNQINFKVIQDDKEVYSTNIGKVGELDAYPVFEEPWVEQFIAAFERQLMLRFTRERIAEFRQTWDLASKFY
jgi:hypothetical protein